MLARLEARAFRNLERLVWSPGPGRHLLLGGNGAGKTSLLEAVYTVATTKSFRTPRLAECTRHGDEAFHLAAEVEDVARVHLEVGWGPGGLERAVNGSRGTLDEHLGVLPVVAWTAAEVEVLTGAPARRRRFLDRGVVSSRAGTLEVLRQYRNALRQKRDLLAADRPPVGAGGSGATETLGASLEAWNRVLAGAAAEVVALRRRYAERLELALAEFLAELDLPYPEIRLRYRPSPACAPEGTEAIAARLQQAENAERRRRMPLLGPHRDDLEILWGGRPVAEVASGGETKALSVALTLAHGRVVERSGRRPVYLLDDLDAELSAETLAALWPAIDASSQVLASSNRPGVWEGLDLEFRWTLRTGRLYGPGGASVPPPDPGRDHTAAPIPDADPEPSVDPSSDGPPDRPPD